MHQGYPLEDLAETILHPGGVPAPLPPLPNQPLVSVIVVSLNYAHFLKETLDSVLTQDYGRLEVIVVDGASTDRTLDILRTYADDPRLRWISEPDTGPVSAMGKGFKLARGDLVGLMPVTDTYVPGAIQELIREFSADPTLALAGGATQEVDVKGAPTSHVDLLFRQWRTDYSVDDVVRLAGFPKGQATLYRRDLALLAVEAFDRSMDASHGPIFLHIMLDALRRGGRVRTFPKVIAFQRTHPSQKHLSEDFRLQFFLQRKAACKQIARKFQGFLSQEQVKTLRRSGYYYELHYRLRARKQTISAIPAALGYVRFGGGSHLTRKLWSQLVAIFMLCPRFLGWHRSPK
jgi:glycosyltransferase involved in cell wall biosynthesis